MTKLKRTLAFLLAGMVMTAGLASCSSGPSSSGAGSADSGSGSSETSAASDSGDTTYDTTITMAFTTAWDSLMPYASASGSMYTKELVSYIFDRLALVSEGGTKLEPRAAESWESADDGYAIIFHLNPDCKWHDGEPVTADDWVWTLEMVSDPDAPAAGISAEVSSELVGTDATGIRIDGETFGAEALDDTTLKLTFKSIWTPENFLAKYCRDISVLPKHLLEDIPVSELVSDDFWAAPIGSGPCIFESETIGSEIYLKANRDYQYPVNGFGTLKCVVMSSSNTLQAEISGDIDLVSLGNSVSVSDSAIAEASGITVETNDSGTSFTEMILNNESLDTNLRLAIYYALDREQGAQIATEGLGYVVDSYVLPFSEYCDTSLKRERDVDKAKEYLAQSDYDGRELQFAVSSSRAEVAAYFQQNLEEAGINVEIITVDVATMFSGLTDGTYDMGISGHTGSAYPLWFAYTVMASSFGNTYYRVSDPTYEEIYNEIVAETDPDQYKELLNEFQQYIFDNAPWIPLWYANSMYMVSPRVEGVNYTAGPFCNDNVWEWVKASD